MPNPERWRPSLLLVAVSLLGGRILGEPSRDFVGVVVEEVAEESAAEKAGVRPGDVIVSWSRAAAPPANRLAAQGSIASPFDLTEVEIEQAPRGPVTLMGRRGEAETAWLLAPVPFGLAARPVLSDALLASYQEGRRLVESDKPQAGAERWRLAALMARQDGQRVLATWLLSRAAKVLADARAWPEADATYDEAIREAEGDGRPAVAAQLSRAWADTLHAQGELSRGDDRCRRALALDESVAPESLAVAMSLNRVGRAAFDRDDLATAERYYQQALALREKLAPGSLPVAASLNNLGLVAQNRGDLSAAEGFHRRSLAIKERLAPGSLAVATSFNNLGLIANERGDVATAEDCYRRALTIAQRLGPGNPDASAMMAKGLNNLGGVASDRGDWATAEDYYRRALDIWDKRAPGSLDVAETLNNLGVVARQRGNLALAEDRYRRVLAIQEKRAPGSLRLAGSLDNLGVVALDRGDLAASEDCHGRALAIRKEKAPGGLEVAESLDNLGEVAQRRRDWESAEHYHQDALAIRQTLAHGSVWEAASLHNLGLVYRQTGRGEDASRAFLGALDALESQQAKLGGTDEARSGFSANHHSYYQDALENLIEQGRPAEALHVLERSRARSLLAFLAQRDLLFTADLPPELALERKRAAADYERVQARIAQLSRTKNATEIDELDRQLRESGERRAEITARIRTASPHFASVHYPEPLDLAGVRQALDPGTVLLTYAVGADKTVLFVVQSADVPGSGLSVFSVPMGEAALRRKVKAFQGAIEDARRVSLRALRTRAMELYRLLIEPAQSQIAKSDRLLLVTDGPLHSLPFAALVRRAEPPGQPASSYLIEWKPLRVAPSVTVYAELRRSRREEPGRRASLVAFGDPRYPSRRKGRAARTEDPGLRAVGRDFRLYPLPSTRREVESIARLFPGAARTYLGAEATEERAKSLGRDVRYVHFASHAILEPRRPLDSALALTIRERPAEGQDNGLLQAWEIFDQVRLDADLVTLSACKTGLGKEMAGEGLLGLTRAFHYAGARAVVATLWAVSDKSTAPFMELFYGYVQAGRSLDEALRAAQIDFIRTRSSATDPAGRSHPVRWAAFQLSGDWR